MKKQAKSSIYATVAVEEGVNYREIADMMTEIGFKMNHSSARNYVLRVMRKFADAITKEWDIDVPEQRMEKIVKSPQFQQAICDILQSLEAQTDKRKE
jgi:transposase-like protein